MFPSLCFFPGPPWVRGKWTGVMSGLRGTVHPSCCWNSRWVKGSETGLRMYLLHTIALLPVSSKRSQALQPLCSKLLSLAADTENPQGPGIYLAALYWQSWASDPPRFSGWAWSRQKFQLSAPSWFLCLLGILQTRLSPPEGSLRLSARSASCSWGSVLHCVQAVLTSGGQGIAEPS